MQNDGYLSLRFWFPQTFLFNKTLDDGVNLEDLGDDTLKIQFSQNRKTFLANVTNKHWTLYLCLKYHTFVFLVLISEKIKLSRKMCTIRLVYPI